MLRIANSPWRQSASTAGASLGAPAFTGKPVVSAAPRFPSSAGTAVASEGASASEVVSTGASVESELVKADLFVPTGVLVGSLARPYLVTFNPGLCSSITVPGPGGAKNGGGGGKVDALALWYSVTDLANRPPCKALHVFTTDSCSGKAAGKVFNDGRGMMRPFKLLPSVKSVRCVIYNICQWAKCQAHSNSLPSHLALSCATAVLRELLQTPASGERSLCR
ncbi:unnamed protein product [Closterium sp. Yama58-4]|nr:unnamed protein product [Closterium sp. Yama58-4]